MTRCLALLVSELYQRRLLLAGSALLGLLALLAPALPAAAGLEPVEVRAATVVALFAVWTPLLALLAGGTALAGDIAERRIAFYLARPLPTWTLWGGKLGAAVLLPLLGGSLVLLPSALAAGSFIALGEFFDRPVARALPPWPLAVLALVALAHAAAIVVRSRSPWLLLDLGALAIGAGLVVEAVRVLTRAFAPQAVAAGANSLALLTLVSLLAAGAIALGRGRTELAAAHRALSLSLWPPVLAGALAFLLFAHWVVGAPIESLEDGGKTWDPPGSGSWVVVGGPAAHRFGYQPMFLRDTRSGRAVRIGAGAFGFPVFGADGSRAAWLERDGESWTVWTLDLAVGDAAPRRTKIELRLPNDLALSPHGRRLAAIEGERLLVFEIENGRLLASPRVKLKDGWLRALFFDENRVRVTAWVPAGGISDHWDLALPDVAGEVGTVRPRGVPVRRERNRRAPG